MNISPLVLILLVFAFFTMMFIQNLIIFLLISVINFQMSKAIQLENDVIELSNELDALDEVIYNQNEKNNFRNINLN